MHRRLLAIAVPGLVVALCPLEAEAHVRWFVSPLEASASQLQCPCHVASRWLGVTMFAVLAGIGAAFWLSRRSRRLPAVRSSAALDTALCWSLAVLLLGAMAGNQFLAPDCPLGDGLRSMWGQRAQALTICALLAPAPARALAVLALFLAGLVLEPRPLDMLEHLYLLGFVGYWALAGSRHKHLAFPVLRASIGLCLALAGCSEKLFQPAWSLAFLATHHWNFLAAAGVSDVAFVLCIGVVEVTLGLLLAAGVFAEWLALPVLAVMVLTCALCGPLEMYGHAPYFVVCAALAWQALQSLLEGKPRTVLNAASQWTSAIESLSIRKTSLVSCASSSKRSVAISAASSTPSPIASSRKRSVSTAKCAWPDPITTPTSASRSDEDTAISSR
jgi:uncharacterized membrane protein YphA (DoxX/SURF4 family)